MKRLDIYLYENGFAQSRNVAKRLILEGAVSVDGKICKKPSFETAPDNDVKIVGQMPKFVGRGGYKLEKAISAFDLDLKGCVCADIGASTGGFTDCMLQNGAVKVYCIDVGYGQLAWKLRSDERVVNLERTNIRYVTDEQIPDKPSFASVDVSFISLRLVLPNVFELLAENGECVCLIKPQFEAGREKVGKKGVVREKATHIEVVENIVSFARETGFSVKGLDFSPIKGPEGNIEYLMYISKEKNCDAQVSAGEVVEASHAELDKA